MNESLPRLLLVDDDPRLRDLLQRYLEAQGFEVRAASATARNCARRWIVAITT